MQAEEVVQVQEDKTVYTAEEAVRVRVEEVERDALVNRAEEIVIISDNCVSNTEEVNDIIDTTVNEICMTETGNIPQIDGQTEIQKGGIPIL